jgi:hypothetical protein
MKDMTLDVEFERMPTLHEAEGARADGLVATESRRHANRGTATPLRVSFWNLDPAAEALFWDWESRFSPKLRAQQYPRRWFLQEREGAQLMANLSLDADNVRQSDELPAVLIDDGSPLAHVEAQRDYLQDFCGSRNWYKNSWPAAESTGSPSESWQSQSQSPNIWVHDRSWNKHGCTIDEKRHPVSSLQDFRACLKLEVRYHICANTLRPF